MTESSSGNPILSVRFLNCMKAIPYYPKVNSSRIRQKITFSNYENSSLLKSVQENYSELCVVDRIKRLLPQANDNMVALLLEQAKNVKDIPKAPGGRSSA